MPPNKIHNIFIPIIFLTFFDRAKIEAKIKPKNKDQVGIAWFYIKKCINLANKKIDVPIPETRIIKNLADEDSIAVFEFFENKSRRNLTFIFETAVKSSSYIPVMNAIVPPETPGIKSAIPMTRPFTYSNATFFTPRGP